VGHHTEAFVGIDTSKLCNAIAIAVAAVAARCGISGSSLLAAKYRHLTFCYEAGPTGYGLYRLLKSLDHECLVVAVNDEPPVTFLA
jgi:hypothetical protein